MKQLFKSFILLLMLMVLVSSCEKVGDKPYEDVLYAKVENASEFSDIVEVKLMIHVGESIGWVELACGKWKGDGFKIVLPKTIAPNYLNPLILDGWRKLYTEESTISVSNPNVEVRDFSFLEGVDKYGNAVASFKPFEIDEGGNVKDVYYTYVDSDVTISGYSESVFTVMPDEGYTGPYEWKMTTTYSIEWKKGWNVWWTSSSWYALEATVTRKYSTNSSSELNWRGTKY